MTSKACFSNRTGVFRQLTAKQLWLFALSSVFLLFLYPLSGMMEYSSITARADLMNLQFSVDRSFLSRTYVVLFMMPVLAIVFSSCFGYLNSRQKLDFYHSQPVTRVRFVLHELPERVVPFPDPVSGDAYACIRADELHYGLL